MTPEKTRGLIQCLPSFRWVVELAIEREREEVRRAIDELSGRTGLPERMSADLLHRMHNWPDPRCGIRYGQPWQAIAKPPYRKELF